MSAVIKSVACDSIADQLGILQGDTLVSINKNEINDVIDFMYYSNNEYLELEVICNGELTLFEIEKDADEPLGIEFETYLIDKQRCCKNKCIFCFIDQLPKGLRETMYFKDDDARLSFLMGNYITLTNLDDNDVERICRMRISPINISVHTTDPDLRVFMMKNPNAALINQRLSQFASAGITMNCQIVLCKNVNDGENLRRTLSDLEKLYPAVNSVSIVPVGLTKFRDGLFPLESFDKDDCLNVIKTINEIGDICAKKYGVRLFYPSDEFFIQSGIRLPSEEYYDGYPQIENGVGLATSLLTEIELAVSSLEYDEKVIECGIITGVLPSEIMKNAISLIKQKRPGLSCKIYPIKNNFFGEKITVAGLVTATDIIDQLKNQQLPPRLLIPSSMLRSEQDMFLDSITLKQTEKELGREIIVTYNDGFDLVSKILNERTDENV